MQFKNEKEATGLSRRHFTHIVWVFDLVVLGHNELISGPALWVR
jgi:hypothetical protein